jgi:hypothetical protein
MKLRGEPLHPAVDDDVVNGDAALGQQFLHVAVLADRHRDHLGGNRKPEKAEYVERVVTEPVFLHPRSTNATVPT